MKLPWWKAYGWTDGGNRTDIAACAYVLADPATGTIIEEQGVVFHGHWTNNQMEYAGVIHCMEAAIRNGITVLKIHSDSQLVVNQINGDFRIRDPKFIPIRDRIWNLGAAFDYVEIVHVPRELNRRADWHCRVGTKQRHPVRPPRLDLPSPQQATPKRQRPTRKPAP